MKFKRLRLAKPADSRPPRGGRGLKYEIYKISDRNSASPPSRGAWIEMTSLASIALAPLTSPPSRGAWIEIPPAICPISRSGVAPLAGGVD